MATDTQPAQRSSRRPSSPFVLLPRLGVLAAVLAGGGPEPTALAGSEAHGREHVSPTVAPTAPARANSAGRTVRATEGVRIRRISYVAHNGIRLSAFVALPDWYCRDRNPPIPLVISPHGRHASAKIMIRRFGTLPGVGGFAVVTPDGHGRIGQQLSWGYRGQIEDLARMPRHVGHALPWVRIDRARVYAVGASMGGQEALLLAAQQPRLLAGVAAFDPVVDFARQFRNFPRLGCNEACRRRTGGSLGPALQELASEEVGGTPATSPRAYAARSPLTYARALAFSGASIQLWWSRKDRVVLQPNRQSGELFRRLVRLNPRIDAERVVGGWAHAKVMNPRTGLRTALIRFGLVPRRSPTVPPPAQTAEGARGDAERG